MEQSKVINRDSGIKLQFGAFTESEETNMEQSKVINRDSGITFQFGAFTESEDRPTVKRIWSKIKS